MVLVLESGCVGGNGIWNLSLFIRFCIGVMKILNITLIAMGEFYDHVVVVKIVSCNLYLDLNPTRMWFLM